MIDRKLLSTVKKYKHIAPFIIGTTMTLGGILTSYTQLIYELGVESQRNNTGVELGNNFELRTRVLDQEELNLDEKTVNFKNIYLVEFPGPLPGKLDLAVYKIRKIVDTPELTKEIGTIITKRKPSKTNSLLKDLWENFEAIISDFPEGNFIIKPAYAQESFNWYGHKHNYDFHEKYIDRYTIRRYYDDGWILEYKVDETGWSIPSSFRWIEKK